MDYTAAQRQAIETIDRNLQIIACAGSGKTQVISARIVRILQQCVPLSAVVAFTFTEKAAGELKGRIDRLARNARQQPGAGRHVRRHHPRLLSSPTPTLRSSATSSTLCSTRPSPATSTQRAELITVHNLDGSVHREQVDQRLTDEAMAQIVDAGRKLQDNHLPRLKV